MQKETLERQCARSEAELQQYKTLVKTKEEDIAELNTQLTKARSALDAALKTPAASAGTNRSGGKDADSRT
jgi:predicted  nucleic acid-binding Zn-ribbon protein